MKVLIATDSKNKYILQEKLREKHSEAEITISGPVSIEIVPKGNTKGNAMRVVMEKKSLKEKRSSLYRRFI